MHTGHKYSIPHKKGSYVAYKKGYVIGVCGTQERTLCGLHERT